MTETYLMTTNRKKIYAFYNKYTFIDFEQINDMMVDIFESVISNMSGELTCHTIKDLISVIKDNNNIINHVASSLDNHTTNITLKMLDIKKDYIYEIKNLIENNDNKNLLFVIEKIEKENLKIIQDIIPKTNQFYYSQYELIIKNFKDDVLKNISKDNIDSKYLELIKNIEHSILNSLTKCDDKICNELRDIKNTNNNYYTLQNTTNEELQKYLDKYKNSSFKGQLGENHIEKLLNNMYKTADIDRTSDESKSGDFIMHRKGYASILFEIKNYTRNVPNDEIEKFLRDCKYKNISGIFISLSSGISNKHNYQIDIIDNNNICVYIQDMNYDNDKLKVAVDILDHLYLKLNNLNISNNITIDSIVLDNINKDFQSFIAKRDIIINQVKEHSKQMLHLLDTLELPNLKSYLVSKYEFKNSSILECDICKKFIGKNLKSLAAHKKKCNNPKIKTSMSDTDNSFTN